MKEILNKYPLHILKKELINVRTSYRLEKQKLMEILKGLKSINKLTKDEVIELLIKSNYDISKLPRKFYTLPQKLSKYNNLEYDEIEKIKGDEVKYNKFNEEAFKYLYKNDDDFKKYSDIAIDLWNKNLELKKYKDNIKFKTEKNKLDDFIKSLEIKSRANFKEAFIITTEYFPNMYSNYADFPTYILTEISKKKYKQIEEYPDLQDFLSGLKSYKEKSKTVKATTTSEPAEEMQSSVYDLYFKTYKEKIPTIEETNKIIDKLDASNEYKNKIKEIVKIYFNRLIYNYDDLKQKLISNKKKWDDEFKIRAEKALKTKVINFPEIAYYQFMDEKKYIKTIDEYLLHKLNQLFDFRIKYINKLYYNDTIKEMIDKDFDYYYAPFGVGYNYEITNFIYNYLFL